ncbi:MAG: UDP-N-acetylglucosamine 2-epimerase (non-hydrolyzing) [Acidobacteriia bacterium]|nr:UDP-N-acetylglucosamine 2-epimerase (non-hydrolyzing) [Terriglobia bacterium]
MKIVSIVGARPQFIKAAAVSRALREQHREILVHTGQHYDYEMSGIFFDGLDLPRPDVNLEVGSGSHAAQTAAMLKGIEDVLLAERPDYLLIYGDTNSTVAGALAASKLSVPVAHVEAGLRSFNRRMPEEINRVVADHLSELLLCPSDTAVQNLSAEGITRNVHLVGDVMLDVLNWAKRRLATKPSGILDRQGLTQRRYLLATVHRSENTDDLARLSQILNAFNSLDQPVVFPVHPRARKMITEARCRIEPHVRLIDPVGYLDMVAIAGAARLILTDSGGLQKEAYWLGVPCLTLRDETEWVETVEAGWNILVGADSRKIVETVHSFAPNGSHPVLYGDGFAAGRCVDLLSRTAQPVVADELAARSILTESTHDKHIAQAAKN